MKKQFIEELQEGDVVNDYYVAARKDLRDTQSGGKFLGLVFKDKTGDIGGVMWNNAQSVAAMFELGDVVNVRATVNTYQNRLQMRVDQVLPLKDGEYDPEDLVAVSEGIDQAEASLRQTLDTIENKWLSVLVQSFLDDDIFMQRFRTAAAGKKWHHAAKGGLIQHCWEMTEIAETICRLYPNIDRDLLMTGVLIHDIGKLDELSHDILVDYTTEGKLLGHLVIGCEMLNARIAKIEGFPRNLQVELQHLIVSHHGEYQFGSPVLPKSLEAIVLNFVDNLDAQTNAYSRVVEETRNKRTNWSEYLAMIERQIWTREW